MDPWFFMDPFYLSFLLVPFLLSKKKSNSSSSNLSKGEDYSFYSSNLNTSNLTRTADTDIRKYKRDPNSIKGIVLHQTGFNWDDNNLNWNKTNTHFVVTKAGKILVIHDPTWRLSHSSEDANEHYIAIEHEGNFKSVNHSCYASEKFGCDDQPSKEQISASRALIKNLKLSYPNLKEITGHIQWQDDKGNCPGPQIWYNIGEWSKKNLGLTDNGPGWADDRGAPIPQKWRSSEWAI